jgi:hypothetical protein
VAVVSVFGGFVLGMQTIRTPEKEAVILDALREHPSYNRACRKARIVKSSLWTWRRDDPAFAERVEAAREEGLDAVEDSLMERATTDDTTAAIFLLKTWRRKRYGDHVTVAGDRESPLAVDFTVHPSRALPESSE